MDTKQLLFILFTAFIFFYITSQISIEFAAAKDDLRLALTAIMFAWILNWMRSLLGSPRLALLFALLISYLVFFKHPNILFAVFGMMILVYFIKPFLGKALDTGKPKEAKLMDFWKEVFKEAKPTIQITPMYWPYYPPPPPSESSSGGDKK